MKTFAIFLISIFSFTLNAQKRFSAGVSISPGLCWIEAPSRSFASDYAANFVTNFGLEVAYQKKHLQLSSGLLYLGQSGTSLVSITDVSNQLSRELPLKLVSRVLVLPLRAAYVFNPGSSYQYYLGGGVYSGVMLEQYVDNSGMREYLAVPAREEVEAFPDFYLGLNVGFGLKRDLTEKLALNVRPNFLYQLNAISERPHRTVSVLLDLSLHYSL